MNDFVAIDFETATQSRESAISIGLVKYHNYRPIDTYYSLIRLPKLYISPEFTDLHGLTVADVKDAPTFAEIWSSAVKPFIANLPLAAHNAHNALDDASSCGKLVELATEKFGRKRNIEKLLEAAGVEMVLKGHLLSLHIISDIYKFSEIAT